jgi:geranylgeranyl diphosphate synthase type II
LLGCDAFGRNINDALPVAYSFELFHNFTLVHDDIMDNAPLRRGKPAVHEKYNRNTAILSGDVMMIFCYEYLGKVSGGNFQEIFKVFNDTAIKICEGQQMDMVFENRDVVAESEYLKMIENKTSVLLAGCLKAGAIIGNATKEEADKIYRFGINIGLTFQLQDDILDAFGDAGKVGKEQGGDIKNNKKTLLLIKALELAQGDDKKQLQLLLADTSDDKVKNTLTLFNKLGVKAYAEQKANEFHKEAFRVLDNMQIADNKKQLLKGFAENLLNRNY